VSDEVQFLHFLTGLGEAIATLRYAQKKCAKEQQLF
jgi:hypothetical protein